MGLAELLLVFVVTSLTSLHISPVEGACYFPLEFQGTFLIQTFHGGKEVTYSEVTVEPDAIPPWGRCHIRRGNNVILKDTTGIEDCMRCFHVILGTPNVIQMHTEGLARCYTSEEAARATCPDDRAVAERRFKEIVMFRKSGPLTGSVSGPLTGVQDHFCPINGQYRIDYESRLAELRCSHSEVSNCPRATGLRVNFRACDFPDQVVDFKCLGEWEGPSGQDKFIALLDSREDTGGRPRYRCGMFRTNRTSGQIYVALSADSTCSTHLQSATDGFETMVLSPSDPKRSPPAEVAAARCKFPEWTQGAWDQLRVRGRTLEYRDQIHHHSVTAHCVTKDVDVPLDQFVIYTVNQCGEETYNCIWFKRRATDLLEYQIGSKPSKKFSENLCKDQEFAADVWTTQGRPDSYQSASPCPITGDYTGVVPGTTGLCAKVSSDCNNPDIMFYTVTNCEDRSHVYEEREYRCLGSWEEDGVVYTYTQRRDIEGYQCFSGKVMRDGEEAYIKEAGISCQRGEDPRVYGMKIVKQASCPQIEPITYAPPPRPAWQPAPGGEMPLPPAIRPTVRAPYWYNTDAPAGTRPWKPITGRPRLNMIPESSSGTSRLTVGVTVLGVAAAILASLAS